MNCEAYSRYLEQERVLEIMFANTFRVAHGIVRLLRCAYCAFNEWQFDMSLTPLVSKEASWYSHSGKTDS